MPVTGRWLAPMAGALCFALAMPGCASVLGLQDLTGSDAGADATDDGARQGVDAEAEASVDAGPDASLTTEAPDAGDASAVLDAADASDAPSEPPVVLMCLATCQGGCCDTSGNCHTTLSTTYCGPTSGLCTGCTNTCAVSEAPCCTAAGKCGCAVGGIVDCN